MLILRCLLLACLVSPAATFAQDSCLVETLAGGYAGPPPDIGKPGPQVELAQPLGVRLGPDGALYVSSGLHRVIRRIPDAGAGEVFAGTGEDGRWIDPREGEPASAAALASPDAMAFAPDGSLYFADGARIRRVTPDGVISTAAGNGETGAVVDGAIATESPLWPLESIFVDRNGLLYLLDSVSVYAIGSDRRIRRLAGRTLEPFEARVPGDGGPAAQAFFDNPRDLVVDSTGAIFVMDSGHLSIRRIGPDGEIDKYLGGIIASSSPDGTPREQVVLRGDRRELEIDGQDRLYWAEEERIRRIAPDGALETVATLQDGMRPYQVSVSSGGRIHLIHQEQVYEAAADQGAILRAGIPLGGPLGEGGPGRASIVGSVAGLAVGENGEIYYADRDFSRIRMIAADGTLHRVAGSPTADLRDLGEGRAALEAAVLPVGLATDLAGGLLYADSRGAVMRIEPDGRLAVLAGRNGTCSFPPCGDGGPARDAELYRPAGLASGPQAAVYVRESSRPGPPQDWIRRISPDGLIDTVPVENRDGEVFDRAAAMAVTPSGVLLVWTVDQGLSQILALPPQGPPREVSGAVGYLGTPQALAVHPNGDLYLTDFASLALRKIDTEGRLRYLTRGRPLANPGGDGPLRDIQLSSVTALLATPGGDLLIGDSGLRRLLRVRNVAECPGELRPTLAIGGLTHGARFSGLPSPGAVFSLFGRDIGPDALTLAQVSAGAFPTEVGGVQVYFDGAPAPLIFAARGQVAGIVPWGAAIRTAVEDSPTRTIGVLVELERDGVRSTSLGTIFTEAAPGFFTLSSSGTGPAAALNQDGQHNGPDHPADPGSVVALYATGLGPEIPSGEDGVLNALSPGGLRYLPKITIGDQTAEVLYAGPAPGLVSGVTQINARIPAGLSPGPVGVRASTGVWTSRGGVTIEVR